jgi:hypothetical protein
MLADEASVVAVSAGSDGTAASRAPASVQIASLSVAQAGASCLVQLLPDPYRSISASSVCSGVALQGMALAT